MQADELAGGDDGLAPPHLMPGEQTLAVAIGNGADDGERLAGLGFPEIADVGIHGIGGVVIVFPVVFPEADTVKNMVQSDAEWNQIVAIAEMFVVVAPFVWHAELM